jgi:hypothetical protein
MFDPSQHTHKSCVDELTTCDVVVLIIGNRWGNEARPEFLENLSVDLLKGDESADIATVLKEKHVSVTQLEALTAFQSKIPVFTFAEQGVLQERRFFEANDEMAREGKIKLPSGTDFTTAGYIFDFLRYVEGRSTGNAIFGFSKVSEIQDHLRMQWSAWMQRMLRERLAVGEQESLLEGISERLEDLKVALVATAPDADARRVASGIIRYRALCEFLIPLDSTGVIAVGSAAGSTFADALERCGVKAIGELSPSNDNIGRMYGRVYLEMRDGRFFRVRMSADRVASLSSDWDGFYTLTQDERKVVFDTLASERRSVMLVLRPASASDFVDLSAPNIRLWFESRSETVETSPGHVIHGRAESMEARGESGPVAAESNA